MLKGFRDFIMRGNVVDLAVAVVIGAAFGVLVTAFVRDFLTPVIGLLGVSGQFDQAKFTIRSSDFKYGEFIDAAIAFIFVAAAVYFFVVVPMNRIQQRRAKPEAEITVRSCPECLSEIPRKAMRCAYCTAAVSPVA